MKFTILWIVIVWGLACSVDSQAVSCDYQGNVPYGIKSINLDVPYYACKLNTSNLSYGDKPTRIEGIHGSGKNDDDVKYLRIYESNQQLQTFSSIFCNKFRNLEAIDASMKFEFIDEDSFRNCKDLKHLDLSYNNFRQLSVNLLATNGKLQTIRIDWNSQLSSMPENFFANQNQLEYLSLHANSFESPPSGLFSQLAKLKYRLDLDDNKMEEIDPKWFENLQNLQALSIQGNELTEVVQKGFQFMRSLKQLWLGRNKITTLHPNSFEGVESLEILSLTSNKISDLPQNVFTPIKSLKKLSLDSNLLTTIHADSFGSLPKLWYIDLDYNFVNSIDERIVDSTAVSKILLSKNVCFDGEIGVRDDIKSRLKTCFANYQPRVQTTTKQPRPSAQKKSTQKPPTEQKQPVGSCGRSTNAKGNIVGGSFIDKGAYPWLAILILPNGTYFCGGVLVSKRKVITAAHCMQDKGQTEERLARSFFVSLGTHDLTNPFDPDRATYAVERVNVHPDWNPGIQQWDADITVLYLAKDVTFSPFIQPICLIPPGSLAQLETNGTVVGYGRSEDTTKEHENIPKVLVMTIIDLVDCLLTYPTWATLASKRNFCAGRNDTKGVCGGDSGGGLFVNYGDTFYLRGVISASLIDGPYRCDVNSYGLFTDVLKYSDWIETAGGNPHFLGKK